jgi:phage terminase Nu1 subunit (DNA packaging protein)
MTRGKNSETDAVSSLADGNFLPSCHKRREKEEISRRAEFAKKQKEEEERRLIEERRRREVENAKKEIEIIRTEEAKKFAQSLKEKGNIKVDINVCLFERPMSRLCLAHLLAHISKTPI